MNKWFISIAGLIAAGALAQSPAQNSDSTPRVQLSAEEAFKQRDVNKDGFLSKTELNGSRAVNRFDQLDANKDGKLSLTEYQAGRNATRGGDNARANREARGNDRMRSAEDMLKARDTDKDGYISKSEAANTRMANRFEQIDANKDGKLSLDELKTARQNMDARGGKNRQKSSV